PRRCSNVRDPSWFEKVTPRKSKKKVSGKAWVETVHVHMSCIFLPAYDHCLSLGSIRNLTVTVGFGLLHTTTLVTRRGTWRYEATWFTRLR
ncbi:hypothetical protein LINGRAHAP2_LOCUS14929, partial [Linum grandiflorum]